jgi:DNA polymerase-3 subunit beta
MKATIAATALLDGLNLCTAVAAARTPKVALQGVLVTATKDSVLLMATDLEVGIRVQLTEVEVEEEGQALVPVAKLSQIVRESSDETLAVETDDRSLYLRGRDSKFQVFLGDPREFPPVPSLEGPPDFTVSAGALKRVIERTLFAAAKESTRYAIDGLLWEKEGDRLNVVATDGRRLALAGCGLAEAQGADGKVIVPSKAVALFGRACTDPEESVAVKFLSNQVLLKSPRVTVSSVLVEGHFPKYQDVIPQDCDKRVEAASPDLLSAVRRAALLTSEESKAVRLSFGRGEVVLTGRAPEQGEASVRIAVDYDDEPLEIGFNPTFLSDVLRVINTEKVRLDLKAPNRPGVFRDGEDYVYVVMPVNLPAR